MTQAQTLKPQTLSPIMRIDSISSVEIGKELNTGKGSKALGPDPGIAGIAGPQDLLNNN